LEPGRSLLFSEGVSRVEEAPARKLRYLDNVLSDKPTLYLDSDKAMVVYVPLGDPPSRWWSLGTIGAGLVLGAAGGVVHYLAWDTNTTVHREAEQMGNELAPGDSAAAQAAADAYYDREYLERVQPYKTASAILYGIGGAAVASGLVWYLLTDWSSDLPAGEGGFSLAPLVPGNAVGVSSQWTF